MDAIPDGPDGNAGTEQPMIRLDRVSKSYGGGADAVQDLSLDIREGEVAVLVGPSGCGKTTTMKMINRLVEPSSGRVLVGGDDVASVDPVELRRRVGYVIQHVGLFPHQTVRANVATVPKLLGWSRSRINDRVDELLGLVGLDPKAHGKRYPHELSGGQQQRVGVARALAADPPVLLMDEPFGAVDPIARDRLQLEFLRLQRQMRKTVVFVTHDVEEAVRVADRIAVLRQGGALQQFDTPARVLGRPATPFVEQFVGQDRALRRLAVTPIERSSLIPSGSSPAPEVPMDATLRDALAALFAGDTDVVRVVEDGAAVGDLTLDAIRRAVAEAVPER